MEVARTYLEEREFCFDCKRPQRYHREISFTGNVGEQAKNAGVHMY